MSVSANDFNVLGPHPLPLPFKGGVIWVNYSLKLDLPYQSDHTFG